MIAIGIDPGVTTGVAVWDAHEFRFWSIESMTIIRAFEFVLSWRKLTADRSAEFFVIVEDARKRKVFDAADLQEEGYSKGARREGVGSVKRDSKIWEEFLKHHGIPFEMRAPRTTKRSVEEFQRLSSWSERTNKHERDAAMIVCQLNNPILRLKLQTYLEQLERGHEPALPSGARLRTGRRRRLFV